MITLLPVRLHWIKEVDDPRDLCAHSPILFTVEGDTLVFPEDGDATVSASAIYLLRTLEREHTKENPVGDQLFPCCGHAMYDTGSEDVVICGCPNGSDVSVTHESDSIVRITTALRKSYVVDRSAWRQAIHGFSDAVRDFYDRSLPKTPSDSIETRAFAKMMTEWDRRRTQT